jgi:hypothetical protein
LQIDLPELPGPMGAIAAGEILDKKDGYEMTEADQQMSATGHGQLVGQFLLDREGIVRWSFTEVPEGGRYMFQGPNAQELMSAVSKVAN